MTATSAVQILYEACKASFGSGGGTPAPEAIDRVCAALDNIRCSDVGLEEDRVQVEQGQLVVNGRSSRFPNSVTRFVPPITYLHLYECDKFSMGIFCLPQSAVIPLHNHPGMTVFSKLLYGSMHVKSFDWVNADPSIPRLAKPVKDHVLVAPCQTSILYPAAGGNIHSFTAVTSCAVLDVLAPPYSSSAGRHCVYYKACSYPRVAGTDILTPPAGVSSTPGEAEDAENRRGWVYLEEFQPPSSFVVHPGNYKGPKVAVTRS